MLSSSRGQATPAASPPPTWQDILALGIVPYRQLTVDDFSINDAADPKHAFYIKTAMEPRYHFFLKPHTNGFVYGYIDQWMVFSGFNKKASWRKSKFKTMKAELPYVQALLEINEIHARQLAALKTGELPNARGETLEKAEAELRRKMDEFMDARFKPAQAEMEAFAKETKNGGDKKKVKQLAAGIRKRLDGTPATTVQPTDATPASPAPSASPAAAATASPAASPSPAR